MTKLLFITLISLSVIFTGSVLAQQDDGIAKKYGISFPISELGNCQSLNECKTFCNDIKNQEACINFAKKKGLYKEHQSSDEEVLEKAKKELGCNSMDECMDFCDKEENMERCMDFDSKYNLSAGSKVAQMKQVVSSLKNTLGCSSMKSCMEVCNSGDHMKRCMEIFQQAGFPVAVDYQETNYQSESPEVWCPKVSPECQWDGSQCICIGPQSCAQNPDCSWNGTSCNCSQSGGTYTQDPPILESSPEPPEIWCPKAGANCSWNDNQCTCSELGTHSQTTTQPTSTTPTDNSSTGSGQDPYAVQGGETIYKSECLSAGCRWSDNPNSCDCAGTGKDVQGISTKQGLLQQIIDFVLRQL